MTCVRDTYGDRQCFLFPDKRPESVAAGRVERFARISHGTAQGLRKNRSPENSCVDSPRRGHARLRARAGACLSCAWKRRRAFFRPRRLSTIPGAASRLCRASAAFSWRCPRPVLQAAMQNDILASLTRLSDAELVARLKGLVARDHDLNAQLVAHLAELDTRDVFLREGYASLFVYCRDALGLSEWEAYNRIEVARAARRFPVILDMLAEGSVNLTAVRLLAPHLTPGNQREVLDSARGKRKPEVEGIVARLAPRPDVPRSVRRLPLPRPESAPSAATVPVLASPAAAHYIPVAPASGLAVHPLPARPAAVTPLSPDRYKLQLTIGGDTLEKLRLAKDMLSHAIPSGDDAALLDRALTALLVDLAKKKFADTRNPRPPHDMNAGTGDPSAHVKRAVWLRDLGRCAFVGTNGHRCNERRFVQFHHVDPRALGGEATVDMIELRCRSHNDYEGRLYFGKRRRAHDGGLVREQPAPYRSCPSTPGELVLEQVDFVIRREPVRRRGHPRSAQPAAPHPCPPRDGATASGSAPATDWPRATRAAWACGGTSHRASPRCTRRTP